MENKNTMFYWRERYKNLRIAYYFTSAMTLIGGTILGSEVQKNNNRIKEKTERYSINKEYSKKNVEILNPSLLFNNSPENPK
jgi:hypothetical protein